MTHFKQDMRTTDYNDYITLNMPSFDMIILALSTTIGQLDIKGTLIE